jgi:hypothetical protein
MYSFNPEGLSVAVERIFPKVIVLIRL